MKGLEEQEEEGGEKREGGEGGEGSVVIETSEMNRFGFMLGRWIY